MTPRLRRHAPAAPVAGRAGSKPVPWPPRPRLRSMPGRMHVSLDRRGRVTLALVQLPASRECHYLWDGKGVTAVTDAEFYGEEPRRVIPNNCKTP